MKNWGNLKIISLTNTAQSLTELATFGSVLLLVMSFFIRSGMNYISQQDMNMRAFRMALADAYTVSPRSNSALILIKDNHIPDPRDTFGIGNVVSVQGSSDVVWGNNLEDKPTRPADLPKIKFVINDDTHEYTTAAYATVTQAKYPGGFWIKLLGTDDRVPITWDRVRSYRPDKTAEPQVMVLLPSGEKEIINEIALGQTTPMKLIISPLPVGLFDGELVTGFFLLDSQAGKINLDYFALNADLGDDGNFDGKPDVTLEKLQGVLPTDLEVKRKDELRLEDRSGIVPYYRSLDDINTSVKVTHKISHNKGTDSFPETYKKIEGASKTWQTVK